MPRHREGCIPPAQGITAYQGKRPCFGDFRCESCGNTWSSANSWRDTSQRCHACQNEVYPHSQRKVDASSRTKNGIPHDEENCGMCLRIGFNCRELRVSGECNYVCDCGKEWHSSCAGPMKCNSCKARVYKDDISSEDVSDTEPRAQWQAHAADAELGRDYSKFRTAPQTHYTSLHTSTGISSAAGPSSGPASLLWCLFCSCC